MTSTHKHIFRTGQKPGKSGEDGGESGSGMDRRAGVRTAILQLYTGVRKATT